MDFRNGQVDYKLVDLGSYSADHIDLAVDCRGCPPIVVVYNHTYFAILDWCRDHRKFGICNPGHEKLQQPKSLLGQQRTGRDAEQVT